MELPTPAGMDLRPLQGGPGIAQERVRTGPGARADHHAHAGLEVVLLPVDREGACERATHALGHLRGRVAIGKGGREDGELVAAEASQHVGGAHLLPQPVGHGAEKLVAGPLSERVVDDLEVVQIHQKDADALRGGGRAAQGLLDLGEECRAVGQPRQRVVALLMVRARLGPVALDRLGQHVGHRLDEVDVVFAEGLRLPRVSAEDSDRSLWLADEHRDAREDALLAEDGRLEALLRAKVVAHHGPPRGQGEAGARSRGRGNAHPPELGCAPAAAGPEHELISLRRELEEARDLDVERLAERLRGRFDEGLPARSGQGAAPELGHRGLLEEPPAELLLGAVALGHVLHLGEEHVGPVAASPQERGADEPPGFGPVRPHVAPLGLARHPPRAQREERRGAFVPLLGMLELSVVGAQERFARLAEHSAERGVHAQEAAVEREHRHADRGVEERGRGGLDLDAVGLLTLGAPRDVLRDEDPAHDRARLVLDGREVDPVPGEPVRAFVLERLPGAAERRVVALAQLAPGRRGHHVGDGATEDRLRAHAVPAVAGPLGHEHGQVAIEDDHAGLGHRRDDHARQPPDGLELERARLGRFAHPAAP